MFNRNVVLVPKPTDNLQDPLNWSTRRKVTITSIWCLGTFVSAASGLGNVLGYYVQAAVYDVPAISLSYSVVAATAGIAVGPLFAVPLAARYGKCFIFFWSMIGLLATGIWSATMTQRNDFIAFVLARLFGGFFGGNATALGARTVTDIYFLHQRGKALTILNLSFLLGIVVGPTFSGYIVSSAPWPVEFWWSNALEACIIVLSFLLLDSTEFDRGGYTEDSNCSSNPSFLTSRINIFFLGTVTTSSPDWQSTCRHFLLPFIIGISPVTILCGLFTTVTFGFSAFFNVLLTVFLQAPVEQGGYGFDPAENATFLFSLWVGIILAQLYGHLLSDRVALYVCSRNKGIWKCEYRLHSLWFPGLLIVPISLGLFGACLQYHLHFMILAISCALGGFSTNAIIPITVAYVVESFKDYGSEVAAILGVYRLAFVIVLPFFINSWIDAVGVGWTLGMAAFFTIIAFGSIILLLWKGPSIRKLSLIHGDDDEDGLQIMKQSDDQLPNEGIVTNAAPKDFGF